MPILPLETFRKILGYNPYFFWGLGNSDELKPTSDCNTPVKQYAWQNADAVGRNEVANAIESAEERLREYLGYSIAPHYVVETLPWPKYHDVAAWRRGNAADSSGRWIGVQASEGYIQAVGVESLTLLGNTPVTLSDTNSDGVLDTFSLAFATAETDPTKLAIYFSAGDRLNADPVSEKYRIKPVYITIAAGIATVRGASWLIVRPTLYEGVTPHAFLDVDDLTVYATQLEAYTRKTDPDGEAVDNCQATLLWETLPCHSWFCCCSACSGLSYSPSNSSQDPAAIGKAVARAGIRDEKSGIIAPASSVRNSSTGIWSAVDWGMFREPDRVIVRYLAGWPLQGNGEVDSKWQTIVARLAAAELGRRIAACDEANQELYHWQFDMSRAAGANSEQYSISQADLDNPLGTRRGQVWAWKEIRNLRNTYATRF